MFPTRRTSWVVLPYCLFVVMVRMEVSAESGDQGRVLSQMIMVSDENDGPLMEQAKKYTDRNIPVILTKYGPIPYKPLPMSSLDQPKDLSPMKKHPSGKGYYKSTITPVDIKTGEPLQPGRESLRSRYEPARNEHQPGDRLQRLEDSFDFNSFPSQRIQRTAAMQFNSPLNQRNDPFRSDNFNFNYNNPFPESDFSKSYFKRESGYRPSFPMDSRIVSDVRFGGSADLGAEQEAALKLALDPRTVEQARLMAERPFHDQFNNMHHMMRHRPASSISETHHHHDMKKEKRHHNSDSYPTSSESHNRNNNNRSHPPRQSSLHSVVRGSYGKTASNIPLY
ncbi:uncharacterized protein LOC111043446 isoform X2 [Nilaparvata lugens]|nr:uncharacterized protein LOC111043446 isoform X2 [Nilaparvata lugens]